MRGRPLIRLHRSTRASRPPESSGGLTRRSVFLSFGVLALCLVIMQLRDLLSYSRWWTDEDQTLLWEAGRDLLHFQLHSPNFWGESYNTVFEGLPGALIHLTGMTLATAEPLGAALMATACWLVLMCAALRRGQVISAALALALPVCLSLFYLVLFDQLRGVLTGDLMGAVAAALAVAVRRPLLRLGLVLLVGGLALVWDNASILVVAPAVAVVVAGDWRALWRSWPKAVIVAAAGLAPAAALHFFESSWYASRPLWVIYGAPLTINASVLWSQVTHPENLFAYFSPELLRNGWLAASLVVVLCIAACYASVTRRRPSAAATALGFAAATLLIMASEDSTHSGYGIYLSGSRFLLPLPLGAWLVAHELITTLQIKPRRRVAWRAPRVPVTLLAIAIIAAVSTGIAQASFRSQLGYSPAQRANLGVNFVNAPRLVRTCGDITTTYRRLSADILVTSGISALPYACTAATGIRTFSAEFDRRRWLVDGPWQTQLMTRDLFLGWKCSQIPSQAGRCTSLRPGLSLLRTPPRPIAKTLSLAGIYYR